MALPLQIEFSEQFLECQRKAWQYRAAFQAVPYHKTPVGNTVDVVNAPWTNTIGAGELITVWQDPDSTRRYRLSTMRASSRFRWS